MLVKNSLFGIHIRYDTGQPVEHPIISGIINKFSMAVSFHSALASLALKQTSTRIDSIMQRKGSTNTKDQTFLRLVGSHPAHSSI